MRRRAIMFLLALATLAVLALGAVVTASAFSREPAEPAPVSSQGPAQASPVDEAPPPGPRPMLGMAVVDTVDGVLVVKVGRHSPAARAGVHRGDLITAVNGQAVSSVEELRGALPDLSQGGSVTLTLRHDGVSEDVTITVEPPEPRPGRAHLGVIVMPIDPEVKARMALARDSGVVIVGVTPESPAQEAGLQRGDIILRFDDQEINSVRDLLRAVATAQPEAQATVVVLRGDQEVTVTVTLGEKPFRLLRPQPRHLLPQLPKLLQRRLMARGLLARFLQATVTVAQDDGQVTYQVIRGELKQLDGQVTVAPAAGGAEMTFAVSDDTRVLGDPQVGQPVLVVAKDDQAVLVVNLGRLAGMFRGLPLPILEAAPGNNSY